MRMYFFDHVRYKVSCNVYAYGRFSDGSKSKLRMRKRAFWLSKSELFLFLTKCSVNNYLLRSGAEPELDKLFNPKLEKIDRWITNHDDSKSKFFVSKWFALSDEKVKCVPKENLFDIDSYDLTIRFTSPVRNFVETVNAFNGFDKNDDDFAGMRIVDL